ncbi:MAG TPA: hypothetical protein VFK12_07890 [Gammaproteobacteria bacterium]|nr:hypothetical protein [Gammaproteobacteria bacterium]
MFALVALIVWLPEGFNVGPVFDGWIQLNKFLSDGSLLRTGNIRAYASLPMMLAMYITPHSFHGWQFTLLLFAIIRGIVIYEIINRVLPGRRIFAVACGLIALFHPADNSFFWLGNTGAQFGFTIALSACLSALLYIQTTRREYLALTFLLQILASLTYSGHIPMMFAFIIGLWIIHGVAGHDADIKQLIKVAVFPVFFMLYQLSLALKGSGRDGHVADIHISGILAGYGHEAILFVKTLIGLLASFRYEYLLLGLIPALYALIFLCRYPNKSDPSPARNPVNLRLSITLGVGLLFMAIICYLPYSVSTVRFGNNRQLLGAGIFLYMLLMAPIFMPVPSGNRMRYFQGVLLALLAILIVGAGMKGRRVWVDAYRRQEQLLSGIAKAVPVPRSGTTIIVNLRDHKQARSVAGLFNRPLVFSAALRMMYADNSLNGEFSRPGNYSNLFTVRNGVLIGNRGLKKRGSFAVPLSNTLLMSYGKNKTIAVIEEPELREITHSATPLSDYKPIWDPESDSEHTSVCTMLENRFRPSYCKIRHYGKNDNPDQIKSLP